MPDQARYLFDNQYLPDVIDKLYAQINATTWRYGMHTQKVYSQLNIVAQGEVTEFRQDSKLNGRLGLPINSYTYFIPKNILQTNPKYIQRNFVKKRHTCSLMDILQQDRYEKSLLFHFGEFLYMNLRIRMTTDGTYLYIPADEEDGIGGELMKKILAARDEGWEYDNRWFLEERPKLSYLYTDEFIEITDLHRIVLDKSPFTEWKHYIAPDKTDWKMGITDVEGEPNAYHLHPVTLHYDTNHVAYLQLTEVCHKLLDNLTFTPKIFLYHDAGISGRTITTNLYGPTNFLLTEFDEYVSAVNNSKIKVMVMDISGGWITVDGTDKDFPDEGENMIMLGLGEDESWIALPMKPGVPPVHPENFRVWEYDPKTDTLLRLTTYDVEIQYPNIYKFRIKSPEEFIYLEWFRDPYVPDTKKYDDWTYPYREYAGKYFYNQWLTHTLPSTIADFQPIDADYSMVDFLKHHVDLESWHDYRVLKMKELLKGTGLHYSDLYEALDKDQARYETIILDMATMPERYQTIKEEGRLRFASDMRRFSNYDIYIDGIHVHDAINEWSECDQYVRFNTDNLHPDSVIIVDLYYDHRQYEVCLQLSDNMAPFFFEPIPMMSGSDIVVTDANYDRIAAEDIKFGAFIHEYLIQLPWSTINWDEIGVDPESPEIQARVRYGENGYKALTFSFLTTDLPDKSKLLIEDDMDPSILHFLLNSKLQYLLVKTDPRFVTLAIDDAERGTGDIRAQCNAFTKRINHEDIMIQVDNYPNQEIHAFNADNYRKCWVPNLSKTQTLAIDHFCGADDPNRLLPFLNGILQTGDAIEGEIGLRINEPLMIQYVGDYEPGSFAEVVYLPFPVDRLEVDASGTGLTNLAGTGIHCICKNDIVFEDGKRIPVGKIVSITNQLVVFPTPGAHYTIIRLTRDSNLFDFEDTDTQSVIDKLFKNVPDFQNAIVDTAVHYPETEWRNDTKVVQEASKKGPRS